MGEARRRTITALSFLLKKQIDNFKAQKMTGTHLIVVEASIAFLSKGAKFCITSMKAAEAEQH
jgi:hypothetical protein